MGGVAADEAVNGWRDRYPRLAAYTGQLPDGLASFPECLGKASVHRTVATQYGVPLRGLPEQLQRLVDDNVPASAWVPQVHTLALIIAMVETAPAVSSAAASGEKLAVAERAWIGAAARALFATPMYKILMWAASPRLLFKGANLRWSAFFRGSRLDSEVDEARSARLVLHAPAGLFSEDLAHIFTHVLTAAVSCTDDGFDPDARRIEFVAYEPGAVHYRGYW